ncbi:hypothetical protein EG68_08743 [Paragonimus skrjabini miyazakii]|uniref:RING-type domain-containing protein n=1 Tax=Paragonimus skrjabini miyazakii TaxID=59628 RepID=A0A8S9YNT0_9TREM|nr:hypothetical protein EG68_08743 [Paragonimus skrjabini miyazakii]
MQLRKLATRPTDPKVCQQRLLHRIHGLNSSVIQLCGSGAHDDEVAQILIEADQAMEQSESAMHQLDLKLNRMKHSEDIILSPTEWSHAWRSHLRRGTSTCPICLCTWTANRERVLLSCSHTFHKVCLERLELMRGQASDDEQQPVIISCPICRWAGYRKLKIPGLDGLLLD